MARREANAETSTATRLRAAVARAGRALRTVLGAPDYDAYVAHHAAAHEGEGAPLTREQYVDARLRARYERPGSRCC